MTTTIHPMIATAQAALKEGGKQRPGGYEETEKP